MKQQRSNSQASTLGEENQSNKSRTTYNQHVQRHFTRSFQRMNPQMSTNLNQVWGFYGNQTEF